MTPKERAKELVDKLYQTTPNEQWYNPPVGSISAKYNSWQQAKQCALIAVDEIIEAIDWHEYETPNKETDYWYEVKTEIENL